MRRMSFFERGFRTIIFSGMIFMISYALLRFVVAPVHWIVNFVGLDRVVVGFLVRSCPTTVWTVQTRVSARPVSGSVKLDVTGDSVQVCPIESVRLPESPNSLLAA